MNSLIKGVIVGVSLAFAQSLFGQTNLNFNRIVSTTENAIQLRWESTSNEVYRIEYANELVDTNTGFTAWQTLYEDYPAHWGTNTFIADCGNYDITPEINHPKKSPMRFYRIVYTGTNTSPSNPTVAITSPTNGATLSGLVTVSVMTSSGEFITDVELFIDGEKQWRTGDGTNFVINTCEWPNGPHTLFAVARAQSSIEGLSYNYSTTYGRSVSAYINVTFDNLISRFDFSEMFFEPSEGQTQRVSASFATTVDWTLEIQDYATNTVRTVTGSGTSMLFDWDGTDDTNGVIADGRYSYLLTAETNSMSLLSESSEMMSFSSQSEPSELYAISTNGSGSVVPFSLYPPGMDTNGLILIEGTSSEVSAFESELMGVSEMQSMEITSELSAYSGSASQSSRAPKRKPRVGVKNKSGTFGICYQTAPDGFFMQQPRTGNPLQPFTGVDGGPRSSSYISWGSMKSSKSEADAFTEAMKIGAYKPKFVLGDAKWSPNDIKSLALGGNSIFKDVNFGLLITHGCYGTFPEIDGVKYTYLALFDPTNATSYLRLSDMAFGNPSPGGMKWMTISSCNMLNGDAVTSMANNGKLPDNGNLHLLLGFNSVVYGSTWLAFHYASNMVESVTIRDSLVNSCLDVYRKGYQDTNAAAFMTKPVTVRVMGYNSCFGDTLYLYNDPDPDTSYNIQDTPIDFTQ